MNLKQAVIYLTWCGEKTIAGEVLTTEEFEKFKEAHYVSVSKAGMLMIKPSDYAYTPGEPYK